MLGNELKDWFISAAYRRRWRSRFPSASIEFFRDDAHLQLIDTDLLPAQWEWFLSGVDGSRSATLDVGELSRDRSGRPDFRLNFMDSIYGTEMRHNRHGASDVVLATVAHRDFLLSPEHQEATLEFLYRAVNAVDLAYGEIAHIGTGLDHHRPGRLHRPATGGSGESAACSARRC